MSLLSIDLEVIHWPARTARARQQRV